MNHKAGKMLGFKPKIKKNQILVAEDLPKSEKPRVINHEKIELKEKGKKYWTIHTKTLKKERKKR